MIQYFWVDQIKFFVGFKTKDLLELVRAEELRGAIKKLLVSAI